VEDEAINSAISSFGLSKSQMLPIYSDEDSSSDENFFRPSTSSLSPSSSASCSSSNIEKQLPNNSLEDAAIDSAISSFGLRKHE
jgi:hypothetical protein